ncbi:MAG: NifU family protein [Actinomycetota bacterium]|nr:NifU family protein [Actinomycetota bacterium]
MTTADDDLPAAEVLARIAASAEELATHPEVGDAVVELLDWVDAFHREGLGRLVEMVRAWRGEIFLEAVAGDEVAGGLLAAYDLGEGARESAEKAVERAMAEIRPLAASHGGDIEVLRIADGVVEVSLHGTCDGCPSSAATLTLGVEAALRRYWVSFRRLEVSDAATLDPTKSQLDCPVPVPAEPAAAAPGPEPPLLQIRGHGRK